MQQTIQKVGRGFATARYAGTGFQLIRREVFVPNAPQLRAGLSTIVNIDTGHRRHVFGLSL